MGKDYAGTKLREERYYPNVRKWLEKKGYYCGGFIEDSKGNPIYFQNKGTARFRVDVAGIKNTGNIVADEIEVVAVEVRDINNVGYGDIKDADKYSRFAHKCYLATTGNIDDQDKEDAQKLGVGLLKLRDGKVKEVLQPKQKPPEYTKMMRFLHALEVAKCPICGCFYETYVVNKQYKSFHKLIRPRYFKVAHDNAQTDAFDQDELRKLGRGYQTYRYICTPCMNEFFPKQKDSHAVFDEDEGGFHCQMGSREHNSLVYKVGEINQHLQDEHGIPFVPFDEQLIDGWNDKFEKQARKYLKSKGLL